jgi:hypothetical protein
VKNRFQSLPFKCNLQRYNAAAVDGLRSHVDPTQAVHIRSKL